MPIYEYHCRDCGTDFEELTRAEGSAAMRCRHCSSRRVTRVLSAFAVGGSGMQVLESGPCGACGAPRRGTCREE